MNDTYTKKDKNTLISHQYVPQLQLVKERLRLCPKTVYYPCCGTDVGPSDVFKDSRVIYVDIDENCISILKNNGYEAYCSDATKFKLEDVTRGKADVIVFFNQYIGGEELYNIVKSNLKEGGYIVCNNYHEAAETFKKNDEFILVGVVKGPDNKMEWDDKNLDEYLKEIKTDEELKQYYPKTYEKLKTFIKEKKERYRDASVIELLKRAHEDSSLRWELLYSCEIFYPELLLSANSHPDWIYAFQYIPKSE